MATLVFAPLVIHVFYSADFEPAVTLMRWICLGMAMRVITWPIGYIIIARGARRLFIATEILWTACSIAFSWVGVIMLGLNGAGIGFFGAYVMHAIVVYAIVRKLANFDWTPHNWRVGLAFLSAMSVAFVLVETLSTTASVLAGIALCVVTGVYAIVRIATLMPDGSRYGRTVARILRLAQRSAQRFRR